MISVAGGQTTPQATGMIVWYFALPGKGDEVYQWKVHACDALEKLGLARGRVFHRQGDSDTRPDVIWQMEYPDEAAHQRNLRKRLESSEFPAVRDHMKTLIRKADLSIWQQN
jgi:hypothetical protein